MLSNFISDLPNTTNENLLLIKVLTNSLPSPSVEPDIIAIFFVVKFIDLR